MRTETQTYHGVINNLLLPGTILLANIDVTGLLEYILKAAAGGAIWLAYKIAADKLEQRKANNAGKDSKSNSKSSGKSNANGLDQ